MFSTGQIGMECLASLPSLPLSPPEPKRRKIQPPKTDETTTNKLFPYKFQPNHPSPSLGSSRSLPGALPPGALPPTSSSCLPRALPPGVHSSSRAALPPGVLVAPPPGSLPSSPFGTPGLSSMRKIKPMDIIRVNSRTTSTTTTTPPPITNPNHPTNSKKRLRNGDLVRSHSQPLPLSHPSSRFHPSHLPSHPQLYYQQQQDEHQQQQAWFSETYHTSTSFLTPALSSLRLSSSPPLPSSSSSSSSSLPLPSPPFLVEQYQKIKTNRFFELRDSYLKPSSSASSSPFSPPSPPPLCTCSLSSSCTCPPFPLLTHLPPEILTKIILLLDPSSFLSLRSSSSFFFSFTGSLSSKMNELNWARMGGLGTKMIGMLERRGEEEGEKNEGKGEALELLKETCQNYVDFTQKMSIFFSPSFPSHSPSSSLSPSRFALLSPYQCILLHLSWSSLSAATELLSETSSPSPSPPSSPMTPTITLIDFVLSRYLQELDSLLFSSLRAPSPSPPSVSFPPLPSFLPFKGVGEGGDGEVRRGWGRLFRGREAVGLGEFLGKMGRLFLPFFSTSCCSSCSGPSCSCSNSLSESFMFSFLFSFFSSFPFDGLVSSFRFRMFCAQFGKEEKGNDKEGRQRRVGGGLVERVWEGFRRVGCGGQFGGFCSLVSVEEFLEGGEGEGGKKWIWRFSRSNPFQLSLAVSLKERGGEGKRVVRHYRTSEGCGVREFSEHLMRFFEGEE